MNQQDREDRLLADALAYAMDQELEALAQSAESVQTHRFSGKFLRGMREILAGQEPARRTHRKKRFLPYAGMAAALVCVLALAALWPDVRMGSSSQLYDSSMEGSDLAGQDVESAPESEAETETGDAFSDFPAALDWQEALLAESAKADELVDWGCYTSEDGDGLILLHSLVRSGQAIHISEVYEVYYEVSPGDWERVYHMDRSMGDEYREGMEWVDGYAPQEYNMTRSGRYRMVRQVGLYRQVAALQLELQ
jgi:hypothetical protein